MVIDRDWLRRLFARLEDGDAEGFFAHVADDVHWTVMGTHPLAGEYTDKATFLRSTFGRLDQVLREGVRLRLERLFVDGDHAIVELAATSTANNGDPFDNTYCWVMRLDEAHVVREVRAYLDSALVARTLAENESSDQQ